MIKKIKENSLIVSIFLFGIFAIGASFYSQAYLNKYACEMCYYQRITWIIISFFCLSKIIFSLKILDKLIALTLIISSIISGYHYGIQLGFIHDFCHIPFQINDINSFKNLIYNSASCKDYNWSFLNFPISFWNFLISLFFSLSFLLLFCKKASSISYRESR